jgi:alcohol dehydrogenase
VRDKSDVVEIGIPRTLFGVGAIAKIGDVVQKFGAEKVLVVTDKGIVAAGVADKVLEALKAAGVETDVYDETPFEAPVSGILEVARRIRENGYGLVVGVGGGSSMDTAKTATHLAGNPGLTAEDLIKWKPFKKVIPWVAVPTTAGTGSEWSAWAAITTDLTDGVHYPYMTPNNYPDAVIIDPEMYLKVPPRVTAETGTDVLAHAYDAFISPKASIVSDLFASFAIKMVATSLRRAYAKGHAYLEDRYNMSIAASFAMLAMSMTGPSLIHLGNEHLGDITLIPHGRAMGVLMVAVMEFDLMADPPKFRQLAEFFGENTAGLSDIEAGEAAIAAVRRLLDDLEMPQTLTEVGVGKDKIPELAKELAEGWRADVMKWSCCRDMTTEQAVALYERIL